jgi:hypothetical protein
LNAVPGLVIGIILLVSAFPGWGEGVPGDRGGEEHHLEDRGAEEGAPRGRGVSPFPVLAYSPETGGMFGAAFIFYRTLHLEDGTRRQNAVMGEAVYTTRKQFVARLGTDTYIRGGDFKLCTETSFSRFPDLFYGVGSGTTGDMEEGYTPLELSLEGSFLLQAGRRLYVGPLVRLHGVEMLETEQGGMLAGEEIPGGSGGWVAGAGVQVTRDTRDNIFYPFGGSLLEVKTALYHHALGSARDFGQVEVDYRAFHRLYREHVAGFQSYAALSGGQVPFFSMPELGGPFLLRGLYEGRYRDKNALVVQGEYRFPLFWRLGGAVFAGAGTVSPDAAALLSMEDLKAAGGFGLKFLVSREQRIHITADVGFSESGVGLYLNTVEAF